MARRRYYRRAIRVVPAKKKWATNFSHGTLYKNVPGGTNFDSEQVVLVQNSAQASTPTPVVVKTGNFKVQGDCYITTTGSLGGTMKVILYVMYLPEVVLAQANIQTAITDHPEWIMAWKVIDLNNGGNSSNANTFSFSSRLKRNLNSGDAVALVAAVTNVSTNAINLYVNYGTQYWTCAN